MNNSEDNKISLDIIMARYMVKYQRLNQLIPVAYAGSNARSLNLFIDIYGLYRTIFSRKYRTDTSNFKGFVSCLINICSHYRQYFKSIGVYAKIFLISSFNTPETSIKSINGYNKSMIDKLMNKDVLDMVTLNTELLNIISPYLPAIYYIHTNSESTAVINFIINKRKDITENSPNLIISTDIYPIQLCAYNINTALLRPLKSNGQDNSMITLTNDKPEFRGSFWGLISELDALNKGLAFTNITPLAVSTLWSLSRFKNRDLKSLLNIDKAIAIIQSSIGYDDISINPDILYRTIPDLADFVPPSLLVPRFRALDIGYQSLMYENNIESTTLEFKDLRDPESLNYINSNYFADEPLDLFRL